MMATSVAMAVSLAVLIGVPDRIAVTKSACSCTSESWPSPSNFHTTLPSRSKIAPWSRLALPLVPTSVSSRRLAHPLNWRMVLCMWTPLSKV